MKAKRGFGAMSPEKLKVIARKGGASVPAAKRAFATKPGLAKRAGIIGGKASHGGGRKRK